MYTHTHTYIYSSVVKLLCKLLDDYVNVWEWYELLEFNDVWNCELCYIMMMTLLMDMCWYWWYIMYETYLTVNWEW